MHFEVCASSFAVWTFSDLMSLCRRWTERNKKHYVSRSMVFARSTLTPTTSAISPAYDPNSKDTWNSHAFCVGTH